MSYNVDELFEFSTIDDGYAVAIYLKKDDPSVTELEIPAKYKGKPVVKIMNGAVFQAKYIKRVKIPPSVRDIMMLAFAQCPSLEEVELSEGLKLIATYAFMQTELKSVTLPKSLTEIQWGAFQSCGELVRVEFNSAPAIQLNAFSGCPKLPPETVVMGLVGSFDITKPVPNSTDLIKLTAKKLSPSLDCFRPDVFELLAKNNCFRNCDLNYLFERMKEEN